MTREHPPGELQMILIDQVRVLNPRDRNAQAFEEIVANIKTLGLKKPVTVTPRTDANGPYFLLICGEGRLKAFRSLGQTEIPAMVVHVGDEDAFIMSLAENIARRSPAATGDRWSYWRASTTSKSRATTVERSPRRPA